MAGIWDSKSKVPEKRAKELLKGAVDFHIHTGPDIYPRLGPTSEWDTAAAHCVVVEAGGAVTDTQLQTLRYNTKASLLNPHFLVFGDASRDWRQYL